MPLYEYRCPSCQSDFEILVRTVDEQPECPGCGVTELEKLLSVPAAPATGDRSGELPMAGGGCGLPQCGQGRCMNAE